MQLNTTNLASECEQLAREGTSMGKNTWAATDALPATIKSLSPQFVELLEREGATVVDIQTSGGFQHRGYLVVCTSQDTNYVPRKGRNWHITKVGPNVFEYRE
jgi:hypothetical protein